MGALTQKDETGLGKHTPYPEYKDPEVEWVGEIPQSWEVIPVKRWLLQSPCYGVLKPDKYEGPDAVPLIRIMDIGANGTVTSGNELEAISPTLSVEYRRTLIKQGDLIVSVVGPLGRSFICTGTLEGMNLSRALARLQVCNSPTTKYLQYVINSKVFVDYVGVTCTGTAQKVLNLEDVSNWSVPCPPEDVRSTIAAFLDYETARIDNLIAKQQRLIELLKEKILSLALSSLEDAETQSIRLAYISDLVARPVHQKEGDVYTPIGLYNRGRGLFHKAPREVEEMGDSDFFWLENGDLIISGQFAWEGAVALAGNKEIGCVVSHRYPVLRGKEGVALTEYIYALFLTRHGDFLLNQSSRGAAGRNRPLNINSLLKETVPLPPMHVQHDVAKAVHWRVKVQKKVEQQLHLLQERRTALISAAVTGKIDVRNWSPTRQSAEPEPLMAAESRAEYQAS